MQLTQRAQETSGDRASVHAPADKSGAASGGETTSRKKAPMRIMRRLLAERKGLFAANLGLRLFKDLLPFQGPILVGIAVDLLGGASGKDRSFFGIELLQNNVRSIVVVAVLMAVLALTRTVVGYVHTIVAAHMGRHIVEAARRDLAEASMQMALDERRRFNSGDLLDRCLADSKGLRSFTQNVIIRVISNTVRAIYPLVLMFMIDPFMALIVLAVIPLQSLISGLLQRRLQRQTHLARSSEAAHTSAVKEAIDGWNSVASVGGQDWATRGIGATAAASEDAKIVKKHTTALISAVITLFTALGIAICYAVGGWRIIDSGVLDGTGEAAAGAFTLGALVTFVGVAKQTYAPFRAYTKIVSSYRTGLVNLERIADVLDAPMIDRRSGGPTLVVTNGDITLDNVSFTYSDGTVPTLRELTGSIPGNALTVITGSSGAGKTTLLRLLLGLDVPSTGSISIDGQDINEATFASVQQAIVLVPQEPVLFSGTLGENLLLGLEEVSTQRLLEACHQAGLLEVVREMPKGLDTEVGSGRHMVSGGQLRRMAIARALLRNPAILLLDEPTTGLDIENSMLVLGTLRRISSHTTVVMVSHRRDPLAASDHHLILRDGGWTNSVAHLQSEDTPLPIPEPLPINGAGSAADASHAAGIKAPAKSQYGRPGIRIPVEHNVIALSAMGRPIVLSTFDLSAAKTRVLMVSGHRTSARPVTSIARTIFAHVANEQPATIAFASIEDLNPDGAWTTERQTVLGVDVSSDHERRLSAEVRALHDALDQWNPDLIIDVAERDIAIESPTDVDVAIRFQPDEHGAASDETTRLGAEIRRRLDISPFTFGVSLVGALPGSATEVRGIPVVEVTTSLGPNRTSDERTIQALVEAAVAAYRGNAATEREFSR